MMKFQYEITVERQLCNIQEAIYEYLNKRGIDCSGCPLEFEMKKEGNQGTDLSCRITGARKIYA